MSAAHVARALSGKASSDHGFLCRCPLPHHGMGRGDRHPSLHIADGEKRLLVRCFAGCDARDVLARLRHVGVLDDIRSVQQGDWRFRAPIPKADKKALALWHAAAPPFATIVERHLREHRGITIPVPEVLRFGVGPSMVAAVQSGEGKLVAVQTTRLDWTGAKALVATPRRTVGVLGDGAVRIGTPDLVLGLSEGTEKALAAIQLTGIPACWASLGAGRMHRVAIPDRVRELHVFADADEPGRAAAERTADQHKSRRVVLHFPPCGCKDWDEVTQMRARRP